MGIKKAITLSSDKNFGIEYSARPCCINTQPIDFNKYFFDQKIKML